MKRERLFYLDLIRAISMLLIVIYHFPLSFYVGTADVLHSTVNGRWGVAVVYVFFMISGASLFYRYGTEERLDAAAYYKRRIISIYPLFYLAYILGFMYVFWARGRVYEYVPGWAMIWTVLGMDGYLNSILPTFTMVGEWFLGAIIIVYALFPLLRIGMRKNAELMLLLLFGFTLWIFAEGPIGPVEIKANPIVDVFFFALGAFISEHLRKRIRGDLRIPAALISGALLLIWTFVSLPFLRQEALTSYVPWISGLMINLYDGLGAVMIFVLLMAVSDIFGKNRAVRTLVGKCAGYTYGAFLIHHLVEAQICAHFDTAAFGRRDIIALLLLCLMSVAVLTGLLYKLMESIRRMIT